MRINSIPGQLRYRVTFSSQMRRMGADMTSEGLRTLLSEVGQTYALLASMGIGLGSPLRSELSYSIRILRAIASTVSKRIRGTDTVGPPYRGRFFICSMNACHSSSVAFTSLETRSAARTISFCMIYSGRSAEILFRDFAAKSSSLS